MGFVERELSKIEEILRSTPNDDPRAEYLRCAQQALSWSLEPQGYSSPTAYLHKFHSLGESGTRGTGVKFVNMPSHTTAARAPWKTSSIDAND